MEILDHSEFGSESNTGLTSTMKAYLIETAKWAKFLAIISFIGIGFLVILSVVMGATLSRYTSQSAAGSFNGPNMAMGLSAFYLVFAVIGIFPTMYLLKFSKGILKNVSSFDQSAIENALSNLKSLFKFHGIVTITIIGLYVLLIFFFAFGGQKMLFN